MPMLADVVDAVVGVDAHRNIHHVDRRTAEGMHLLRLSGRLSAGLVLAIAAPSERRHGLRCPPVQAHRAPCLQLRARAGEWMLRRHEQRWAARVLGLI